MSKILIHFREGDKEWAEWVERQLGEAGYEAELFPWSFEGGTTFFRKLELYWKDHKTYIIPILSPHYLAAIHSKPEWVMDVKTSNTPVLPVRVKRCIVDNQLFSRLGNYIDVVSAHPDNAKYLLLEELRGLIGQGRSTKERESAALKTGLERAVFQIPVPRNDQFSGRERVLAAVHQSLVQQRLAVVASDDRGMGGVGRRQVTVELAHARASDYQLVWWMRANHPCSLIYDYARIADVLGLDEKKVVSTGTTVQAIRTWLKKHEGWLLIFDRLRKQEFIPRFVPTKHNGQVLITTNAGAWPAPQNRVLLRDMDRQESIVLLNRETGQLDEGAAAAVAARLRDYPLALKLAARYVAARKLRMTDFFDHFDSAVTRFKGDPILEDRRLGPSFLSFWMSAELLKESCAEALDVLCVCAHLAADDIRIADLTSGINHLTPRLRKLLTDHPALNKALKSLDRLGLVELDSERGLLSLHPVVQRVTNEWRQREPEAKPASKGTLMTRLRSSKEDRQPPESWRLQALKLIFHAFPSEATDTQAWSEFIRLMPHAFAVIQHNQTNNAMLRDIADLYVRIGRFLDTRGLHAEAVEVLALAMAAAERSFGAENPQLAVLDKTLGKALWSLGRLPDARLRLERALKLDQAQFKPANDVVSKDHTVLGSLFEELDDLFLARQHYEAALAIDEALPEENPGLVARDFTNLGLVEQKLGNCSQAWRHYERALDISKEVCGEKHESISTLLKNMGGLMRELGDLPRARDYIKRAIEMDKELYGAGHPELSRGFSNYGLILQEMGELDEAREYYELALGIDRALYGPRHRKVAIRLNNIASVLQSKGDLATAHRYYDQAYRILESSFGRDHPLTVIARQNLDQVEAWLANPPVAVAPEPAGAASTEAESAALAATAAPSRPLLPPLRPKDAFTWSPSRPGDTGIGLPGVETPTEGEEGDTPLHPGASA
ncbi:MAG: toll/interleukin-1 receptor domain-containing protein [Candidatus Hydrogenedentes bacterium]|nr:toll/interleukin-1 receptor domain-containing protein [Candidatus Hydrogenedentota bacterium]